MKRYQFSLAISSIAIAVAFIGCGKKHEEETQQTKADQNVVTLTKENLEHVEIKTEPAELGNLATTLKAPGRVSANANKTARISSTLEGRLVTLHVDLNDRVKRGDVLALVEAPELLGKQLELKAPIDGVIVERKTPPASRSIRRRKSSPLAIRRSYGSLPKSKSATLARCALGRRPPSRC